MVRHAPAGISAVAFPFGQDTSCPSRSASVQNARFSRRSSPTLLTGRVVVRRPGGGAAPIAPPQDVLLNDTGGRPEVRQAVFGRGGESASCAGVIARLSFNSRAAAANASRCGGVKSICFHASIFASVRGASSMIWNVASMTRSRKSDPPECRTEIDP